MAHLNSSQLTPYCWAIIGAINWRSPWNPAAALATLPDHTYYTHHLVIWLHQQEIRPTDVE
jgi:hypothetical protein